ncbi:MAG: hypothetical protein KAR19_14540 [Bacteroidales bacterium]|nr:hypothetical protein [Bacteroidales bacterium]
MINTHEHQHWPEEYGDLTYRLFHLIHRSYLMSDIISAGGQQFDTGPLDSLSLKDHWDYNGQALDYSRNTSYYSLLTPMWMKNTMPWFFISIPW